jgi:heme/copper-type cytochrome/quinol oxidase subunit 3
MILLQSQRDHYQAKLGFYLLLVSLGVFFLASMVAYLIIAVSAVKPSDLRLHLPLSFIGSTLVLISISVAMHFAVENVHHEKQRPFRVCLLVALALSFIFCFVQWFGLHQLLDIHRDWARGEAKLYGISFTLALVHALHVVGGLFFLWFVTARSMRNVYDHERHYAVDLCASYWHFLDGVWLVMLGTFLLSTWLNPLS